VDTDSRHLEHYQTLRARKVDADYDQFVLDGSGIVYDSRAETAPPSLHALIVGIDDYPYMDGPRAQPDVHRFGFRNLTSSVNSARSVHDWLIANSKLLTAPLGTIRLILTQPNPTFEELSPTSANVLTAIEGWYTDSSSHPDNVALLYWAGHGFQHGPDDDIALLLEDFGMSRLRPYEHSISFRNLYLGMAPSRERQTAHFQLYFVDASRQVEPSRWLRGAAPFNAIAPRHDIVDTRVAPIFYSTFPGGMSYGRVGGATIFSQALLSCLSGSAAEPTEDYDDGIVRWHVTVGSLNRGLRKELARIGETDPHDQVPSLGGQVADQTICKLREPPPSRSLVIDHRGDVSGTTATHALIVGISSYPFLRGGIARGARNTALPELGQLSSAAASAFSIFQWLHESGDLMAAPLATVRLLLSPSEQELRIAPELSNIGDRATLANFLLAAEEWRQDLARTKDGLGLFYFGGHGAQRQSGDSILLMEDLADGMGGLLRNAVDVSNLYHGLAPYPAQKRIARKQLFFIDACRMTPVEFLRYDWMTTSQVFNVERGGIDDRAAPIYSAALPGAEAYGEAGGRSLFTRALLDILRAGGEGEMEELSGMDWITVDGLRDSLDQRIAELGLELGVSQRLGVSGSYRNFQICLRARKDRSK
jgi:hypothetical protein